MKKRLCTIAVSIIILAAQQVTAQTGGFNFKAAGSPADPQVAATWN